ncbi:Calx-beta domain-containing protein [Pseudoduganella danionis]|uniref:DUF4214 domain-containing protein n=1 Tax=Pseudoduganella danionis TaxID=1890295 RepID=A0ABW9STE8_9BURK|nr:Calx-beta domain-containing protein [Pseudoduganella danionis]MTW34849.1 DUF4214 domain-containing protein [Pseudoduganella danionis]
MSTYISINDPVVSEGSTFVDFVISLSAASANPISVYYSTSNATTNYSDFESTYGTLQFAPGVTTQTVRIALTADSLVESMEMFQLTLSSAKNAVLTRPVGTAVLMDNDVLADAAHPAMLSVRDLSVDEAAGTATFTVLLDKATSAGFAVTYSTADGTAIAGSDYSATSGTLNFIAGETAKTITVPLINDAQLEGDEFFNLVLTGVSGAASNVVQLGDNVAQATIIHNDQTPVATPVLNVAPVAGGEGDGYVDFVVTLNGAGANEVSVYFSTSGESAGYSDYDSLSGNLVFAPGVTSQVVRVPVADDKLVEGTEIVRLNLSSAVNASIGAGSATALIVDNDNLADASHPASLQVRSVTVDESSGMANFVLTLDKATSGSFSVAYNTTNGSAVDGSDYTGVKGLVTFGPGETVKTISVPIINDSVAEAAESFQLNLGSISGSAASSVQVVGGSAQAIIGGNDQTALAKPFISVADAAVGEGDGYIDFVVSLNAPATTAVSVYYSTSNDTSNYSDYYSLSGTLTFAPGVTTQVVRVALSDDLVAEQVKAMTLNLSSVVNATIAKSEASGLLFDNDTLADTSHPANLSVHDVTVDEAAGSVSFVVSLDKATSAPFNVAYSTSNGTAREGSDFIGAHGTVSFAAGETAHTVTVLLNDDVTPETVEQFYMNLGIVSGKGADQVALSQASATAVIGASDQTAVATPVVSVASTAASEADGYADFVVSLSAPSSGTVSVYYSTNNDTTGYSDYASTSGTLVFAPGVTTQTVRVALVNDLLVDGLEILKLNLSSPVNATIGNGQGSLLLVDNDTLADTLNPAGLSVRDVIVDESAGTVSFAVLLDKATNDSFSVSYTTVNGSAVAGSDYAAVAGTLSFAAGETLKIVTVPLINDSAIEQDEVFSLQLGGVTGKAASSVQVLNASGNATIIHNDQAVLATPSISVSNPTAGEADGYVDFVVSLNGPSSAPVSVYYSTNNATTSYSDYASASGTLVFAPGVTSQVVRVALVNDNLTESAETLKLTLNSAVNATLAGGNGSSGIATIIDNDTLADTVNRATLSVQDISVNETAGTATFALVLSKATSSAFNVAWSTADGTALAGSDYAAASGVVGFGAGETFKLVTVSLINDPWLENAESFQLRLSNPTGAGAASVTLGSSTVTATINSEDLTPPTATMTVNATASTVTEGNSVTFNLASTGLAAGSQIGYTLSGVDAARLGQPLNGVFTVDGSGGASVKLNLLENGKVDAAAVLKLSLLGTPTSVSSQVTVTDMLVQTGTAGADQLKGTSGNDKIDGGAGLDTLSYTAASTDFDIRKTANGYVVTDAVGNNGSDLLNNVERLNFSDKTIALDISGTAGIAYRVYQAAFDRAPDLGGLGFWIAQMDKGLSATAVAGGFIDSAEFTQLYGLAPSNDAFVGKLYSNVLHRTPDQGGYDFWVKALGAGVSRAEVLAAFSESGENQAQVIGTIQNGFEFKPFI